MTCMSLLTRIQRTTLWLWALPLTLCGLPLWLLMRVWQLGEGRKAPPNKVVAHINRAQAATVFVAYGAPARWLLQHHFFGEMDAMAVGCCIFAQDDAALQRTMAHELVHVEQALHWGPLFPLAYVACAVWQKCQGQCPYTNNYFERQANRRGR
jgi:hypothetical protein